MASIVVATTVTITDEQSATKTFTITKTITGLTALEERDYPIAADETKSLWDPTTDATEAMSSFDFLLCWADGVLDLEFTVDAANTPSYDVKRLEADMPLMLAADASVIGTGQIGQVAQDIDAMRVDEPVSAARKLKVIMGKV